MISLVFTEKVPCVDSNQLLRQNYGQKFDSAATLSLDILTILIGHSTDTNFPSNLDDVGIVQIHGRQARTRDARGSLTESTELR